MAGFRVEWVPGSRVIPDDINLFIQRARANVFPQWRGFPLLGAHCYSPPGVEPMFPWNHTDPLPDP
eukprot:12463254-Prorocentrum_lima.AAC.1